MDDKLQIALNQISDHHIDEAAQAKRKPNWRFFGAIAAILAIVLLFNSFGRPISAKAVALADYSQGDRRGHSDAVYTYTNQLQSFFTQSISQVLSGSDGENAAYSPINLYLGLAAVAELTGGDAQILQALKAKDLETLRKMSTALWNVCYQDSGNQCLLANSLWLDNDLCYNQAVMDNLAKHHYTSVYQGNFGSRRTNRDIANWLNNQTGNLLKSSAAGIDLDPQTVFALYSTIYYQAKWQNEFKASENEDGIFHTPDGDVTCTYMNKEKNTGYYYWGEDFGAVSLFLKDGCRMWLILPDEGKTVDDVLSSGEYTGMFLGDTAWENCKDMYINLSLPKFDIRANGDLKEDLQKIGITNVFDPEKADFSAAMPDSNGPVWLSSVNQATRVAIDEKGVTAASYIEFPGAGAAAPPEDTIDFVLDRPFIFLVTNYLGVPLFAGVVNEP